MHLLIVLHRWWGIVFCLLFAMWFASGIVMHFVPFPARKEAVTSPGRVEALGEEAARDVAAGYMRSHGFEGLRATTEPVDYDQWTVSGDYNSDRPLIRVTLNDAAGTVLYVSSTGGDIVLVTTQRIRMYNYFGSIAHWIYPAALRHHAEIWRALVWWLSLIGTIGVGLGVVIGTARLGTAIGKKTPAYQGLQFWHHTLGLIFAPFIFTWVFSGFLSLSEDWPLRSFHTLDFAPLTSRPLLRSVVIVTLCLCGLAFSLAGAVLAWRRVRTTMACQKGR
jgi:hypothetical protein